MGTYGSSWAEYRKTRLLALIAPVIFFVSPLVLAPISLRLFDSLTPAFPVAILIMIATAYCEWRFFTWLCPSCSEPFGIFGSTCRNCSLQKWAENGDEASS